MLLQIPVENAIKHGLRGKSGAKRLNIRIRKGEKDIEIVIWDNGGGYRSTGSHASASAGTGTGMKVITRTLQLLNAYNRSPIVMKINNVMIKDEARCEVYFKLPLDYSYELRKQKKSFYGTTD